MNCLKNWKPRMELRTIDRLIRVLTGTSLSASALALTPVPECAKLSKIKLNKMKNKIYEIYSFVLTIRLEIFCDVMIRFMATIRCPVVKVIFNKYKFRKLKNKISLSLSRLLTFYRLRSVGQKNGIFVQKNCGIFQKASNQNQCFHPCFMQVLRNGQNNKTKH